MLAGLAACIHATTARRGDSKAMQVEHAEMCAMLGELAPQMRGAALLDAGAELNASLESGVTGVLAGLFEGLGTMCGSSAVHTSASEKHTCVARVTATFSSFQVMLCLRTRDNGAQPISLLLGVIEQCMLAGTIGHTFHQAARSARYWRCTCCCPHVWPRTRRRFCAQRWDLQLRRTRTALTRTAGAMQVRGGLRRQPAHSRRCSEALQSTRQRRSRPSPCSR